MAFTPRRRAARRSLTAAAEKLADRLAISATTRVGEGWQGEAWDMYDDVPEVRTACRITGQAMSQCRLVLARVNSNGEPSPLDDKEAAAHPGTPLLNAFAGGLGGQAAFLDMLGTQLTVPGEGIAVGALDPEEALVSGDDFMRMQLYSPDQVRVVSRQITVRTDESMQGDRAVNEDEGLTAIRIWRPHPRRSWQADSAVRSAMTALREIVLYDKHIEATGVSRLISAGLLGVPEGLTLPGLPAENNEDEDVDPFMRFLLRVMATAIADRSSAAARVPILIRGEAEDIAAMKKIDFATPFDAQVPQLRKDAIARFGTAVDMPGELLTGFGSLQHWTGALITDDWKNSYLPGLMQIACWSLTTGWLYKALPADTPADVILWYDDSGVRTRENTGPEAQAAFDRRAISAEALRRVLGFDDSDAPDDETLRREIAISLLEKAPALAPLLMPYLGFTFTPEQLQLSTSLSAVVGKAEAPGGPGAAPGGVPPETGNEPLPSPIPGQAPAALELERLFSGPHA